MGADLTSLTPVFKDDYKDLTDNLNERCWLLPQITKNTDAIDGLRAVHAVHLRRNSGVGSRGEGGTMPAAGKQGYAKVPVPLRYHFAAIQLTGQSIRQASNNAGAFVDALDSEMQGAMNDAVRDRCRQIWGTSNGVLAQCGTTTTSNDIVLATGTTLVQMRHLWNDGSGQLVDIGTVADPDVIADGVSVDDYDDTTPGSYTITVSGSTVSTTSSHFIFRHDSGGASDNSGFDGDGQFELTGMQTIVDSTSVLHTIDPSTEPGWKSFEVGSVGIPTEMAINNAITKAQIASGQGIDALVCSEGVHQTIASRLLAQKRAMNTVDLKGGYSGIEWNAPMVNGGEQTRTVLVIDQDCPGESLFGINFKSLVWYQDREGDWDWSDEDGAVLRRSSATTYSFDGLLVSFAELAAKRRNSMFKLTGITETNG